MSLCRRPSHRLRTRCISRRLSRVGPIVRLGAGLMIGSREGIQIRSTGNITLMGQDTAIARNAGDVDG